VRFDQRLREIIDREFLLWCGDRDPFHAWEEWEATEMPRRGFTVARGQRKPPQSLVWTPYWDPPDDVWFGLPRHEAKKVAREGRLPQPSPRWLITGDGP